MSTANRGSARAAWRSTAAASWNEWHRPFRFAGVIDGEVMADGPVLPGPVVVGWPSGPVAGPPAVWPGPPRSDGSAGAFGTRLRSGAGTTPAGTTPAATATPPRAATAVKAAPTTARRTETLRCQVLWRPWCLIF